MANNTVKDLQPMVNHFIMKYIPDGFQDKNIIEDWLTKDENQDIMQNFLEEKNIEEEKLFDALLAGTGANLLRSSEMNLINEKFSSFKNVFDIVERLKQIQIELEGNPSEIEYTNVWLFGIKDNISHYISVTGIGQHLCFETELEISDYYDSLFKSMIPVPDLPEENITKQDLENYFNSSPEFEDKIEEKVRVDLQSKFYQIMNNVLKQQVAEIIKEDFVFISNKEDYEMGVDIDIVVSNADVAKRITTKNFFDDVERLMQENPLKLSKEKMCEGVLVETKKQILEVFNETYKKFKNNPKLEPLNKHKKPLKVKFM